MAMTHEEQRLWLIRELQKDEPQFIRYKIPADEQGQKDYLRAMMNVWQAKPLTEEFLRVQDAYLTEETRRKGIVRVEDLEPVGADPRLFLWQGDMTRLAADAVVNPANSSLEGCFRMLHGCLDNILHSAAGIQLRLRCNQLMQAQGHPEPTGQAKITPAYNLPSDYVIHTVGPIVQGRLTKHHEEQLASCYRSCLEIAEENDIKSIAFCCISTGVFMFPNQRAAEIAVATVRDWLQDHDGTRKVVFNVFKDIDLEIYDKLLNQ